MRTDRELLLLLLLLLLMMIMIMTMTMIVNMEMIFRNHRSGMAPFLFMKFSLLISLSNRLGPKMCLD